MATFTSLREAARYAGVSYQAIRDWAQEHQIGELRDGRWHIDREKLDHILASRARIEELKSGFRQSA